MRDAWVYISEIEIENFRLFKSMSVELNNGLNVIVGENNSGKTALIDAIRLTLDTNSSEWTRIFDWDFHEDSETFHIQLKFDGITPDQAHAFVEHLTHEEVNGGTRKSVLYVNLIAHRTDKVRRGSRLIRTEFKSGKHSTGTQIERDIRDYLSVTYLKPLRDAEAELSAGRGSRLSQILSSSKVFSRDGKHFKELLEGLIGASKNAEENEGIKKNRENISTHFESITFADDEFQLAIQLLGSKNFDTLNKVEKERAFTDILEYK
jgi:putative ATP-dependent endonuclease of the OLD family